MNPILNSKYLIPDVEARVMPNGRLYIYGSQDKYEKNLWCCYDYHVFSCEDSKLEHWTDHGVSFQNHPENGQVFWNPGKKLYAPDVIYKNGEYLLYFCGENNFEGVAFAECPEGPFIDPRPVSIADGDSIDPAVFVDDDGSVYYFWGQYELRGAKLKEDLCTIDESTLNNCIITEPEHGFHEGSSIRKKDGKYYLIYCDVSRGRASCLSYAMSDHPLGPYKKGGVIIDNIFCDPDTWNNHGSIECFNGQWYVFYHRACNGTKYWRRVCVEPIYFDSNGHIKEVEMTSNGASDPLNALLSIPASCACRVQRNAYIHMEQEGEDMKEWIAGDNKFAALPTWIEYKYLNFHSGVQKCTITAKGSCKVRLRTNDNQICGTCTLNSDDFQSYRFSVNGLAGIKPIWFDFSGGAFELVDFCFS